MEYIKNCRVLTHALFGSRECIPVELQEVIFLVKWHLQIMKFVRSPIGYKLSCPHMQDIEEVYAY